MNTVYLTVGASSSGKSTWAKQRAAIFPGTVIACRDDIRRMMGFPPVGDKEQEKTVTVIQRGIIETALLAGKDVIVADTNLNKQFRKHLIKFIHEHGADVKLQVFDVGLADLLDRTKGRPQSEQVPDEAIRKQHASFVTQVLNGDLNTLDFPVQSYEPYSRVEADDRHELVVVDIDGTVANHQGVRSPYDYSKVAKDRVHQDIVDLVQALSMTGYTIVFVSGREDSCREDTEKWIDDNVMMGDHYTLLMREAGDSRPDWIIKNEIYDRELIPNHNIAFVLDDRDQVVRHLRRRGIRVLQVAPGRF